MNRPTRIASVILAAVLAVYALDVWHMASQRAHRRREETYQLNLQRYSKVAIPGMTREQVEDYLRNQSTTFQQMCCIVEHSAFADLVLIGRERAGFPCDYEGIYVAFEFAAAEQHDGMLRAYGSDVLKRASIFRWMQGCLWDDANTGTNIVTGPDTLEAGLESGTLSPVATREPGSFALMLSGVGLLRLLLALRRSAVRGTSQQAATQPGLL
jgi:hypothetical protein